MVLSAMTLLPVAQTDPNQERNSAKSLQRYSDRRALITGGGLWGSARPVCCESSDEGGRVVAADISRAGPTTPWRRARTTAAGARSS